MSLPALLPALHAAPSLMWRAGPAVAYRAGHAVESVVDVASVAALGKVNAPHRLVLAPPHARPAQLALFDRETLPGNVLAEHEAVGTPTPAVVYALPGLELAGGGLLHADGKLFRARDVLPVYYDAYLHADRQEMGRIWTGALFDTKADICTVGMNLAVAVHPNVVYGHFLLEMLPRLAVLAQLRRAGLKFLLALHSSLPAWAAAIVRLYFAEADLFWYDPATTRLRCRCFIVPGMMHVDHRFSPAFNDAIAELQAHVLPRVKPGGPQKIWFSRAGHAGRHGMTNEAEAAAVAQSLGYAIIDPKPLSLAVQMALMAGATHIAGAYGSALHNSIFAPPGTKVFCINRVNWYQSGIAALRGQSVAYFPPADGWFRESQTQNTPDAFYAVDCAALRATLQRFEDWTVTS